MRRIFGVLAASLLAGAAWAQDTAPEDRPEIAPRTEDTGKRLPPLPRSRPDVPTVAPSARSATAADNEADEPSKPIVVAPPRGGPKFDQATAKQCENALRRIGVAFSVEEPINGPGPCGHPRPLVVASIKGVELEPEPTMRCEMALGLAKWMVEVVIPSAKLHLDAAPQSMSTAGSYGCRKRRGSSSTKYSEHAFANALDISGVSFTDRDRMQIKQRSDSKEATRAFQAAVRGGACAYFTTVIGPMTNAAHADHLHIDMAERRGGYRLCE